MTSSSDRRQYQRLPKNFRVEVREFKFPLVQQKPHEVCCTDISEGGLRVECPDRFEVGDKVTVKIFIPSLNKFHPGFLKVFESDAGQYLQAIAEIMWVEERGGEPGYALGIRFLDVDHNDWKALGNLIRKFLREQEENGDRP
ncbi:type IV pilus assembly PilZ [Desulfovibrio sp. X2]|uniref:PilZ domain-containing protein n=1 Tax=Desulfovibrio sp. X2 TaxID=941449 RepID=UPI000358A5C6|nr:PilZ domain-containing protein [Desulfovibrio sp. X2]EPR37306.1 type IV pilus assembly PilZ [Desulfovibrio sp. X2]